MKKKRQVKRKHLVDAFRQMWERNEAGELLKVESKISEPERFEFPNTPLIKTITFTFAEPEQFPEPNLE